MNAFDLSILQFLNSFSRRSEIFDAMIVAMSRNVLLQGGLGRSRPRGERFA
jgi:hypothetical protein